jgi:nuclear protein localization protein 4 homolog
MFRSTKFNIENRPGMEDQKVEDVLRNLAQLGAQDMLPSSNATANDMQNRVELAKWLSDWHLTAFLGTTQLISQVCPNLCPLLRPPLMYFLSDRRTIWISLCAL